MQGYAPTFTFLHSVETGTTVRKSSPSTQPRDQICQASFYPYFVLLHRIPLKTVIRPYYVTTRTMRNQYTARIHLTIHESTRLPFCVSSVEDHLDHCQLSQTLTINYIRDFRIAKSATMNECIQSRNPSSPKIFSLRNGTRLKQIFVRQFNIGLGSQSKSGGSNARKLARSVVIGDLHLKILAAVS